MVAKAVFVLCASVLLLQSISGQCTGYANNLVVNGAAGWNGGCGAGLGGVVSSGVASASGGGFSVSSSSPIAPSGISVVSNNDINGALAINGQLPVLAAVAVEGQLPSSGSAGTSYSCGDSNVGISSQSLSAAGIGAANSGSIGLANAGYNNIGGFANINGLSLGGSSCGCGSY